MCREYEEEWIKDQIQAWLTFFFIFIMKVSMVLSYNKIKLPGSFLFKSFCLEFYLSNFHRFFFHLYETLKQKVSWNAL